MKRIILTGGGTAGHVTPNLALIPTLQKEGWEIHYIGTADGIEKRLRTDRTLDDGIAWSYISDENLGLAPAINADGTIAEGGVNLDKNTFEALPAIKLQDVIDFQKANVKGRTYRYGILGKIEDLDMEALSKIGKVVVLTTEDIFGY